MLQTRVQSRPEDSRWRRNEAEATRWVSKGAVGENLAGESKNTPSLGNHGLADSKGEVVLVDTYELQTEKKEN